MKTLYTAVAIAEGGREGHVASDDGIIDMALAVPKELGGNGGAKTNPEQLFAAGYASCYGSALQHVAALHKVDLGDFSVTANVSLGKTEDGDYQLEVILDTYLPGQTIEIGEQLVNEAHEVCPYSRATENNIDVTLNLLLDE